MVLFSKHPLYSLIVIVVFFKHPVYSLIFIRSGLPSVWFLFVLLSFGNKNYQTDTKTRERKQLHKSFSTAQIYSMFFNNDKFRLLRYKKSSRDKRIQENRIINHELRNRFEKTSQNQEIKWQIQKPHELLLHKKVLDNDWENYCFSKVLFNSHEFIYRTKESRNWSITKDVNKNIGTTEQLKEIKETFDREKKREIIHYLQLENARSIVPNNFIH